MIWEKLICNVTYSGPGALMGLTTGQMQANPSAWAISLACAREAEAVAQKGLTGEVGTQRVVEATLELESTVKMMVSMRDKVIEAYQEIMRMPI